MVWLEEQLEEVEMMMMMNLFVMKKKKKKRRTEQPTRMSDNHERESGGHPVCIQGQGVD